ncbi:hypothetical protein H310_04101 [Aphanomyces invadans]|uniref:Uncharacterized protein n=1 Tax=Aphanomyces invadans TaxID=157072 RepID=A0A024UF79_9STRA|nr:hypothetical protein H310_04101 [Aphanomyces invadans]ETW05066.1 hypothetical protein H310_04101 [Aphanomyces invadans]RHY30920.1 hypothetical protein DYB32_003921 [Aphanomyces invadans]|eukprot:XP_008866504.1 hypothetical protein H310_04101 [Aphanomyces invadans]
MQVVIIAMTYVGPMAVKAILQAIEGSDFHMVVVIQALAMLVASKILSAFVTAHADLITQRMVLQCTSALQHMLFLKTLRLDAARRREKTAGDIANLFSSDMQWITAFATTVNQVWTAPVRVIVTLVMLYNVIGWAAFVGSGALALAFAVNHSITILQRRLLATYMLKKDGRMKAVAEIFGNMKIVKLQTEEARLEAKITALRRTEMKTLGSYVFAEAAQTALLFTTPVLTTLVSFFTYTIVMRETLSVSKIFTAMSLFALLKYPMMGLPQAIVAFMQAFVAVERMEEFLTLEDKPVVDNVSPEISTLPSIEVSDATFGWDASTSIFRNVSLAIDRGELVVLHGAVSQGKSSLCAALLGEMVTQRGTVAIRGAVAYVPQQPWIQHMTIRDNILFGLPFDRVKYNRVIEACALTSDFASLPAGDRMEIGQRGVNLSGGQQARISLARACYTDADIFILDAPLAAMDAAVQRQVFSKCILGLLATKTVVLVTHNPAWIASPAVHRTLELVDNGTIVDNVVLPKHLEPEEEPVPARTPPPASRECTSNPSIPAALVEGTLRSPVAALADTPLHHDFDQGHIEAQQILTGKLIAEEARSKGRVSKAVVWTYGQACGGWPVLVVLGSLLVSYSGVQVASDLWLSKWSNTAANVTPEIFLAESSYYLTIYSLLVLTGCGVAVGRAFLAWAAGLSASRVLFSRMTTALFRAPMAFFDTNPVGRVLNRYGNDLTAIDTRIPSLIGAFFTLAVSSAFTVGTTVWAMKSMAVLICPLLVYYYRMALFYLESARAIERIHTVTKSPLLNLTAEIIDDAHVVRANGQHHVDRLVLVHHANVDRNNQAFFTAQVANQWFHLRTQLFSACMMLGLGLTLVVMRMYLSPGIVGLVLSYTFQIFPVLEMVVFLWSNLETQMVAAERVVEYTALPSEPMRVVPGAVAATWPVHGEIEFDNVSFRYKPTDPLVLKHVSVRIAGGEHVGLVGRTGAGKSSLTMALFRMHNVASGVIRIDGVDIASVGMHTVRSRMAIVPQSPVLFQGTVRMYLDPNDDFTDDRLWASLRKVHLAHRFEAVGGKKLEWSVNEGGSNYSVGERQILCLARALLRQAKVVVMDEATAATDAATDDRLQHIIRTEFQHSTVLIIAHRLSSVRHCDRIMVFENGRVVQCDSPDALLVQEKGVFHDLCRRGVVEQGQKVDILTNS